MLAIRPVFVERLLAQSFGFGSCDMSFKLRAQVMQAAQRRDSCFRLLLVETEAL